MTGYARPMIEADCNLLAATLERAHQYDFIEADLGRRELESDTGGRGRPDRGHSVNVSLK
jgi:hypothetical protein